jgi:hypothetical protein
MDLLARMGSSEGDGSLILGGLIMTHAVGSLRYPVALGFLAYLCAHVALFSLIGLLGLPMPALFWAMGGLLPGWGLVVWLVRCARKDLADLVAIQSVAFAGSVLGLHGRALYCAVWSAL